MALIFPNRAYGVEVNSTLSIGCNDGGGGTEVSRDVRHIAGQAWRWNSVHTRNDNPAPGVEVGLSRADVMLGDSAYWLVQILGQQGGAVGSAGDSIGGSMSPFEYMIVRVECDGDVSNNNDFAGDFTVYGRIVEHTGMSVNPATIDQNGSSNISWSGAHAWESRVTISDGGQTIQKGGDPNGSFTSSHTYTNGGYVGTVNVETCVTGYSWSNEWTSICQSRDITVEALVSPTVDILCAGGNGPCTINQGDYINISWSESNASSCWTTGGGPDSSWPRDPITPRSGGSEDRGPLTSAGTYNYTYTCDNANGSDSDSVTVFVNATTVPIVDLRCGAGSNGPCTVASGTNVNLSWTSANVTTCTASGGTFADVNPKPTSSAGESHGPITAPITYNLLCTGPLGSASDSVVVSPGAVTTVDLKCNNGGTGGPYIDGPCWALPGGNFELQWTSTNADTCIALRVPPATNWEGSVGLAGPKLLSVPSGQRLYRLTCTGTSTAVDEVTVNPGINNPPTASSVKATEPDYCIFGPSITVSWVYTDPEGTTQTAYRMQIDDNAGFSSPDYDSGKILSSSTAIYAIGLTWNTTYRARVMVWDGSDNASAWAIQTLCQGPPANPSGCAGNQQSWKSPNNQYPSDLDTFSWTPAKPALNKPVQFDDGSTTCYKTPPNTVDVCLAWNWIFGDGGTSTLRDPSHTYANTGSYDVNLKATDQQNGYTCGYSKTLNIQKPIPFWKEVLPQ